MPFTFSHPAIVLPLAKFWKDRFSLTGLIIGSLTPDFEYFMRMKIKSEYSHTFLGIFWLDIPLALIVAFLFHNLVKDSLINNLPVLLKSRFSNFKKFNWNIYFENHILVVFYSILIGALSHILWDDFTHKTGFFVTNFSSLNEELNIFNFRVPIYKILQHSSSLIGVIFILYVVYKLPKDHTESQEINIKYWLINALLITTITLIRFFIGLNITEYGSVIVTLISATMLSLILTPMLSSKDFSSTNVV